MNMHSRTMMTTSLLLLGSSVLAAEQRPRAIEEIVVTAEKRASVLQDTPITVSAITDEAIRERGIQDFAEVQYMVPALVYAEISDMAQISMRGVGVDISTIDAEPGVALYVDGAYRGGLSSSASLFMDIERIEVLRGPQGTLYGRNSTGGALNVITRQPGETFAYDVSAELGSHDRRRASLFADLPLVPDVLALRAGFSYQERGGYATNQSNGQDIDDVSHVLTGRATLRYTPTANFEALLRGEWGDSKIGGPVPIKTDENPVPPLFLTTANPGSLLTMPGVFPQCGEQTCADFYNLDLPEPGVMSSNPRKPFLSDETTKNERDYKTFNLTLTWEPNDSLTVRSITSYTDLDQKVNSWENDGTNIDFFQQTPAIQRNEGWSQEINVSGLAFDGRLDWIVGAFYYESDIHSQFFYRLPALQRTFEALFGLFAGGDPLPPGSLAGFGVHPDGSTDTVPFFDFLLLQDLQSTAVFGQGAYQFTDRLSGTAGLRWTRDKKQVTQFISNNLGGDVCLGLELDDDWTEVTGRLGLDYRVSNDMMVYGNLSRGFKAGGFNLAACDNPYDPETILAYELGVKSQWLDNRLQVNAAAFYYDYQDLQARLFVNNAAFVRNASDVTSYGAEVEFAWLASDRLRLEGNVSWLRARFDEFTTTNPMSPQVGFDCDPVTGLDCQQSAKGNSVVRAPDWKVNLAAIYELDLARAGFLALRAEYAFTDDIYHNVFNDDFARQSSYALGNLRATWSPSRHSGLSVQAFVENVTNKDYVMVHAPVSTIGGTFSLFAPPRTWGLVLRYSSL